MYEKENTTIDQEMRIIREERQFFKERVAARLAELRETILDWEEEGKAPRSSPQESIQVLDFIEE